MNIRLTAIITEPVTACILPIISVEMEAPMTEVAITPEATLAWGPKSSRARL